jgi:uncharacterized Zn finger protein
MKNPYPLTDDDIRRWVGDRSFDRGRGYFHAGNIVNPRRQGNTFKARCLGSLPHAYHLDVTLSDQGITHASCSCPVGAGGHCKHVAALLLIWVHTPERFSEVEELEANLRRRSKEELIAIVQRMLAHSPDLESLLELPVVSAEESHPINPAVIRKQVNTAFKDLLLDTGSLYEMEQRLQMLVDIGDDYARLEAWQDAATVYGAVAERVLANYEWYYDEGGELTWIVEQCVEGLEKCLAAEGDPHQRERILRMLFDIYVREIAAGGFETEGIDAPTVILDQATPEERRRTAHWVREALAEEASSANDYHRRALGGLLIELEMDELNDEDFLRVCRETGRWHDLVDRLLVLGRVDEAVTVVGEMDDYALLRVAHLFERHGYTNVIEELVRERVSHNRTSRLVTWLAKQAQARGDLGEALQLEEELFWKHPTLQGYQQLENLAQQAGRWQVLRRAILHRLAEEDQFALLVDIHLEEGDVDQALQALGQMQGWRGRQAIRVAEAAEGSRPREAMRIYVEQAERLIAVRGRDNYAKAAMYLARVRELYRRLGEEHAWATYITTLREENPRLRALKDELNKAGL